MINLQCIVFCYLISALFLYFFYSCWMIWLVHLIYSAVGFALCYNYVILNYCIRFAVLPYVRLCLNSCYIILVSLLYFGLNAELRRLQNLNSCNDPLFYDSDCHLISGMD